VNPAIYAKLPYDTLKDFVDIAPLAMQPNVLVVDAGSPYWTLRDLVKAARARPGALNWGHAGNGTGTHLNAEKFIAAAKIDVTQIPYKGTPEVIQGILGGSVDCFWAPISAAIPYIRSGRVRPLAVSTRVRTSLLPHVPTTGEAGVTGADAPLWIGLWALGSRRARETVRSRQRDHGHAPGGVRAFRPQRNPRLRRGHQGGGHSTALVPRGVSGSLPARASGARRACARATTRPSPRSRRRISRS
jgi:hypothetical protein